MWGVCCAWNWGAGREPSLEPPPEPFAGRREEVGPGQWGGVGWGGRERLADKERVPGSEGQGCWLLPASSLSPAPRYPGALWVRAVSPGDRQGDHCWVGESIFFGVPVASLGSKHALRMLRPALGARRRGVCVCLQGADLPVGVLLPFIMVTHQNEKPCQAAHTPRRLGWAFPPVGERVSLFREKKTSRLNLWPPVRSAANAKVGFPHLSWLAACCVVTMHCDLWFRLCNGAARCGRSLLSLFRWRKKALEMLSAQATPRAGGIAGGPGAQSRGFRKTA